MKCHGWNWGYFERLTKLQKIAQIDEGDKISCTK